GGRLREATPSRAGGWNDLCIPLDEAGRVGGSLLRCLVKPSPLMVGEPGQAARIRQQHCGLRPQADVRRYVWGEAVKVAQEIAADAHLSALHVSCGECLLEGVTPQVTRLCPERADGFSLSQRPNGREGDAPPVRGAKQGSSHSDRLAQPIG